MNRCLLNAVLIVSAVSSIALADDFKSAFPKGVERVWIGPEYWANPLQDWQVVDGELRCRVMAANRSVHLLTHQADPRPRGDLWMSVHIGRVQGAPDQEDPRGWAGFRIVQGPLKEYRNSLIHGRNPFDCGITNDGKLFIGEENWDGAAKFDVVDAVELKMTAKPEGDGYTVTLTATNPANGEQLATATREGVAADRLVGNLALVSDFSAAATPRTTKGKGKKKAAKKNAAEANEQPLAPGEATQTPGFVFTDWQAGGSKIVEHEDQTFGPVLFAMHTLSDGVMKMTAQMPPIGEQDDQTVTLQTRGLLGWRNVLEANIDPMSRTATFRIEDWQDDKDVEYRLLYDLNVGGGKAEQHEYTGTVRKDPVDKERIVVAGFTGNTDPGFPNHVLAEHVKHRGPDLLFFSGDQLYENVGGFGVTRSPVDIATLDYLRKWYIFGWAFRDLMRDIPSLSIPDDHDVYQGNIWGGGGRHMPLADHPRGGYDMPAEWVNMVQRTQTAHHPDPYDPTPVAQGITVYYGPVEYGRVSFAVIEDRKFKSGPQDLVDTDTARPDHQKEPVPPKALAAPEAELLGDRQIKFLREWGADWRGADFKVVLSQTIFANVANYHGQGREYLFADLDSNGWPRKARNEAVDVMRRGYAFHLAGDQHLASIVEHGIEEWGDAGWSFCVPSIAVGYPRSWLPKMPGLNREMGAPEYTGDFHDGFGNPITVHAIANPVDQPRKENPLEWLHDKTSGFGIVVLDKPTGRITMECWPLLNDPADADAEQFPGWPMTIDLQDNYGREAAAHLPTFRIRGMTNPVVQVINDATGEIEYTLRIRGDEFQPKVFTETGTYTVRIGEPGTKKTQTIPGLPARKGNDRVIEVKF